MSLLTPGAKLSLIPLDEAGVFLSGINNITNRYPRHCSGIAKYAGNAPKRWTSKDTLQAGLSTSEIAARAKTEKIRDPPIKHKE